MYLLKLTTSAAVLKSLDVPPPPPPSLLAVVVPLLAVVVAVQLPVAAPHPRQSTGDSTAVTPRKPR